MHFSNMGIFSRVLRRFCGIFAKVLASRDGNFALTFAFLSVPILLGVGVSIDYVRAYNVKVKMQADLDAALIASVKAVDSLSEDQIKDKVAKWFVAQAETQDVSSYTLAANAIVVSKTKRTISAVATGIVPTTFLGLANIKSVPVSVTTSVAGPATSYLEVYLVLDKSASMMLAATSSGQASMKTVTKNCVFACHEKEGGPYTYNGRSYITNYDLARGMGIDLRADISVKAVQKVFALINAADPGHSRIEVGLYSIGLTAKKVLAPTLSTSTANSTLIDDNNNLTSATSEDSTYFDVSLPKLAKLVGTAGDGETINNPLKLVLLLTDGVQSSRPWVMSGDSPKVSPLNPGWCSDLKNLKATIGVLYTEYLPMTWDTGYSRTLNQNMKSSEFAKLWGGTIRQDVNASTTKRSAYIPLALQDCATSKDLFLSAASSSEIEQGLGKLFEQYLGSVRLTQ